MENVNVGEGNPQQFTLWAANEFAVTFVLAHANALSMIAPQDSATDAIAQANALAMLLSHSSEDDMLVIEEPAIGPAINYFVERTESYARLTSKQRVVSVWRGGKSVGCSTSLPAKTGPADEVSIDRDVLRQVTELFNTMLGDTSASFKAGVGKSILREFKRIRDILPDYDQ